MIRVQGNSKGAKSLWKEVYAAIDVERNELILMRVYPSRNYLTTKLFVSEVLKYCENKPKFIVDKAPWLIKVLESLGLDYEHQSFRKEKSRWIRSFKQRVKIFFCSITAKNPVKNWNLFCKLLILYYNHLRSCLH